MAELIIDGWKCVEYLGMGDTMSREATRKRVTWSADESGLDLQETPLGYEGGAGSYGLPANVAMWLMQAVR